MPPILSLAYLPVAIGLGALHALEPGHAKTMTAAYLIGINGRWSDAVLLGLSAAATHSLVVIGLAVAAVLVGREAFAGEAIWWLQVGSGAVVVLLGAWMLWRRLRPASHAHDAVVQVTGPRGSYQVAITGAFPNERMTVRCPVPQALTVEIARAGGACERLTFTADPADPALLVSNETPAEPHAFTAALLTADGGRVAFVMEEPHDHQHADDLAHARAHAADMPAYVASGTRPSWGQVVAFGAAGGLVPCPASVTVMLLALSVGSLGSGVVLVAGFSIGLALALVGVGLAVVVSLRRLGREPRFAGWLRHAPVLSASVVIASGLAALVIGLRS